MLYTFVSVKVWISTLSQCTLWMAGVTCHPVCRHSA